MAASLEDSPRIAYVGSHITRTKETSFICKIATQVISFVKKEYVIDK